MGSTIGERVRQYREFCSLSQAELARAAGTTPNTLWRIEAGLNHPRPATIRKLAQALGVEPHDLTGVEPSRGSAS